MPVNVNKSTARLICKALYKNLDGRQTCQVVLISQEYSTALWISSFAAIPCINMTTTDE